MKKLLTVAIAMLLALLCVACGNNGDTAEQDACKVDLSAMSITGKGASIDDNIVNITKSGIFDISGSHSNVMIYVDAKGDVTLRLNQVGINNPKGPAIYIAKADNAYINVVRDTVNYISDGSEYASDDVHSAITSNAATYINGSGFLHVTGNYKNGVYCSDLLELEGDGITIEAKEYGVKCDDRLSIANGGANVYSTTACGVFAEKELVINGGNINIVSYDDAVVCNGTYVHNGGILNVETSGNGIVAKSPGGKADDAFAMNRGSLFVKAEKNGVDITGNILINGGNIIIDGPSTRDFCSVKTDGKVSVNGGSLLTLSNIDSKLPVSDESQAVFGINTGNQTIGSVISITDMAGKELLSHSSLRDFSALTISHKEISSSNDYKLYINGQEIHPVEY